MVVLSQAIEDVAAAPPNEAATAEMAYMAATTAAIEVAATAAATVESTLVATVTGDAMHPMTIVAEIAGGEDGEEEGEDDAYVHGGGCVRVNAELLMVPCLSQSSHPPTR